MMFRGVLRRQPHSVLVALACAVTTLLVVSRAAVDGGQAKVDVLRIGTSGNLASDQSGDKEESALATLKAFIKEETDLDNEIRSQKDWRELAEKLAKGELHLGVFQGY